jgi:putative DNA primase/helicase
MGDDQPSTAAELGRHGAEGSDMTDLRSIARALGGDVVRGGIVFPAPGHSRKDRSASVRFDPQAPSGFVAHSFAGEDPLPIRDHVREVLQLPDYHRGKGANLHPLALQTSVSIETEVNRSARALALWAEARDPRGTLAEVYLSRRGLALPDVGALRFHSRCPFADKRTGAMLALVRDIRTNKPQAIHRTALTQDGSKAEIAGKDRLALGPVAGGAVKLTPDEDVTTCLGIGEGIESTLSLQRLPEFGASPVWAVLSAGALERFPVLPGIEVLWIAVDHDPTGTRAAHQCAERWRASGAEVLLVTPSAPRADLNDIIR